MIHARPRPEKQWPTFIVNDTQKAQIQKWIDLEFKGISICVIYSKKGNGSRHLLHALANEVRKKGLPFTFFSFQENEDAGAGVLEKEIAAHRLVFIDCIDEAFRTKTGRIELVKIFTAMADKKCRLIFTMTPSEKRVLPLLAKIPFYQHPLRLKLEPLSREERLAWRRLLLETDFVDDLAKKHLSTRYTNAAFLETIKPHLKELKERKERNQTFVQDYMDQLTELNVLIRKKQLELAELEHEKAKAIRYQHYEQAASIREREKNLTIHKLDLFNSLKTLYRELPFLPSFFELHYQTIALLYEFDSKPKALTFLNRKTLKYLDSLKNELLDQKKKGMVRNEHLVLAELQNWQHTLERFDTRFKWYK